MDVATREGSLANLDPTISMDAPDVASKQLNLNVESSLLPISEMSSRMNE